MPIPDLQREGVIQRSRVSAGHPKVCCCHQLGTAATLMAAGWKSWCSPSTFPTGLVSAVGQLEAGGTVGPASEPRQRPPSPTVSTRSPHLPVVPSRCLSSPDFTARSRFRLWGFPGKPGCWQMRKPSAGWALASIWMGGREKAGPGAGRASLLEAAAHPRGSRDTACALPKASGLKPTQAPLSQGKGGSTLNPGFVFRR